MRKEITKAAQVALLALLPISGAGLVSAEGTDNKPGLSIELSAAEDNGQSCLLSFVAENHYAADVSSAIFETVLFGAKGEVALLTLLDFKELPSGRPRVRQFQFDGMACDQISRILINGAQECKIQGDQENACLTGLDLKSRLETEMIG